MYLVESKLHKIKRIKIADIMIPGSNTPLYGLNSVPLITMIEQKKFRASYEIHSNQDLEHNFLYIFFR